MYPNNKLISDNFGAVLRMKNIFIIVVMMILWACGIVVIKLTAKPEPDEIENSVVQNQKNIQESFQQYRKDAEAGSKEAQYELSNMYAFGSGVERDEAKSAEWCQKAAASGHPDAQLDVGIKYQTGNFYTTTPDYAKAFEWYQKAAASGHSDVQWRMGFMYIYGEGVPKDNKKAVECFQKGAASGCRISIARLNWMYKNGKDVEKDEVQAALWRSNAKQQN